MVDNRASCSVVLEGGVTSAVIYTKLLACLSRHYKFRHLGGASSGAVAAAAAAAAEFARQNAPDQQNASFDVLGEFPNVLAERNGRGETALFRLFQPTPKGQASFRVAMAALDQNGGDSLLVTVGRVIGALLTNFSCATLLLTLLVICVGWLLANGMLSHPVCGLDAGRALLCAMGWIIAVLPTVVVALLMLAAWALVVTVRALRDNHWGLCSGANVPGSDRPALTPTLNGFFQQLAERTQGPPLTFGDLWREPGRSSDLQWQKSAERHIDLQIITSAVSMARPVRLPGDPGANPLRNFFYDPKEWSALFPADIMQHLISRKRPATLVHDDGRELIALPDPEQWPVLMAARFSLSFPLLLSAVPMYIAVPCRDVLLKGAAATKPPFQARKVYFSDGGITSNCPVHLFDAPFPRFPTFGINLFTLSRGSSKRVTRSDVHDPEFGTSATPDATDWTTPLPFLFAIFSTMFGWRDSLQRALPGYRERIVHIGLPPETGGLHLAMKPKTIRTLGKLGSCAARQLHRDFSQPRMSGDTDAWERHRWTRARTTLSALRAYLRAFVDRLADGEPSYSRLLGVATPVHYPFEDQRARQQALDLAEGARALMQAVESTAPPGAMDRNTPEPLPVLHMSPPW